MELVLLVGARGGQVISRTKARRLVARIACGARRISGITCLVQFCSQARLCAWIQGREGLVRIQVRIPSWAFSRLGAGLLDLRLCLLLLQDPIRLWIALVGFTLGGKTG
jgi:hypothetical protein